MALFLIDEDLPRSIRTPLEALGHEVLDVRDVGLRGKSDREVFAFAQRRRAVLLTADLGFANTLEFPFGTHAGIVVLRDTHQLSPSGLQAMIATMLRGLSDADYSGNLVVVSTNRVRIRRPRR